MVPAIKMTVKDDILSAVVSNASDGCVQFKIRLFPTHFHSTGNSESEYGTKVVQFLHLRVRLTQSLYLLCIKLDPLHQKIKYSRIYTMSTDGKLIKL